MLSRRDFIFRFYSCGHKFITTFFPGYTHRPLIQNAFLLGIYPIYKQNKNKHTDGPTDRQSDK